MKTSNILLLGASLDSDNQGVNALAIGALTLLDKKYKNAEFTIVTLGTHGLNVKSIELESGKREIDFHIYTKYEFLVAIIEALLFKLFHISAFSSLGKLFQHADKVYNINEGDSFSDLYGAKRILRHFIDSKIVLLYKKPLVFLPQTIGPFNTRLGKILSKNVLQGLSFIYVRDDKAFNYLDSLHLKYSKSIDMAVYMKPLSHNFQVRPNSIGININGLMYLNRYDSLKGEYEAYPRLLQKIVNELLSQGFNILFIPHTYNAFNPIEEDDLVSIDSFIKQFKYEADERVYTLNKALNAQEIKYILSQLDFFIGSRMHSCIGALSTGVPTIGLAYSYKFEGTFEMFNQKDHVFSVPKGDFDRLSDDLLTRIKEFISRRAETKLELARLLPFKYLELND